MAEAGAGGQGHQKQGTGWIIGGFSAERCPPTGQRRLGTLRLTNYIGQSLICTTLFYGYGFGLFGKVSPTWGVLLTLVLFLLQIPFSIWWLARWRFGPLEWVWRSLTYGKLQPMRKELEGTA